VTKDSVNHVLISIRTLRINPQQYEAMFTRTRVHWGLVVIPC